MENASKALLIAGAILLAILIISLGITVYNQSRNTVSSSNLSKQEIQAFNSQWELYVGENKTAIDIQTMSQEIISSNGAEQLNGTYRFIALRSTVDNHSQGAGAGANTSTLTSAPNVTAIVGLPTNTKYKVTAGYDKNGLIVGLMVEKMPQ